VIDLYAENQFGATTSIVLIVSLSLALVAIAIVSFARARRRAALAASEAATMNPRRTLREGDVVLSGVVEHAPEHDVAVRVEVTQHGTETESSGTWSHSWREVDRQIIVAPFYLRLADGTRVRVEAPRDVDVADDLDQKVLVSRTSRVLSAELVPGEELHVRGWLERGGDALPAEAGYRDVTWGWVLRAGRGRMLLSSAPLGKGLQQRAAFHRRYGRRALALLAGIQLSLAWYYARATGDVEIAQLVDRHHTTHEDSDGDTVHDYDVVIRLHDGSLHTVDIEGDDFLRAIPQSKVMIRRGALGWKLGARSTLSYSHGAVMLGLVLLFAFAYHSRRRSTRPWFRRRVDHRGAGRLPSPPTAP
jgi:hypothetical protein